MKILSLDQSTVSTGFAVFIDGKLMNYGLLTQKRTKNTSTIDRMANMINNIDDVIQNENPDYVVIEDVQWQGMIKIFKTLARFQGTIIGYFILKSIPFLIIEPSSWKSFCGIKGKGRKEQKENTKNYIKKEYGVDVSEDVADSICIGICASSYLKENADGKENYTK